MTQPHPKPFTFFVCQQETSGIAAELVNRGTIITPSFVGICLNNRMNQRSFLEDMIGWMLPRFRKINLLVLDSLERFNESALNQTDDGDALASVMKEGQRITSWLKSGSIGRRISEAGWDITSHQSLTSQPSCVHSIHNIRALFQTNTEFRRDIETTASEFLGKMRATKPKRYRGLDKSIRKDLLHEYLIEEMGTYLHLFSEGYRAEVYPGPDSFILQNLAKGVYGSVYPDYANRMHIGLIATRS